MSDQTTTRGFFVGLLLGFLLGALVSGVSVKLYMMTAFEEAVQAR